MLFVTLLRGRAGKQLTHLKTLDFLRLYKPRQEVAVPNNAANRGQIEKVRARTRLCRLVELFGVAMSRPRDVRARLGRALRPAAPNASLVFSARQLICVRPACCERRRPSPRRSSTSCPWKRHSNEPNASPLSRRSSPGAPIEVNTKQPSRRDMFAVGATPVIAVVPASSGARKPTPSAARHSPRRRQRGRPSDAVHFQQVNLPPVFPRSRRRRRATLAGPLPKRTPHRFSKAINI